MRFMVFGLVAMVSMPMVGCDGGDDGEETAACEEGTATCDGDFLVECVDGEEVETDCAADGMMCHEEMGHCMAMDM